MKIKGIIFEDLVNYKKASMTIIMPYCSFKCDKECGSDVCQNSHLSKQPNIDINIEEIINNYYINNGLVESIVFQGLEPFDSFDDLCDFISQFVKKSNDDIVIYTGYNKDEIKDKIEILMDIVKTNKLIIKFGRFIPNKESHKDEVLGVTLASDNQYAEVITK